MKPAEKQRQVRIKKEVEATPACPSANCKACNGEACEKCGAGCWRVDAPRCDHDVIERHQQVVNGRLCDDLDSLQVSAVDIES